MKLKTRENLTDKLVIKRPSSPQQKQQSLSTRDKAELEKHHLKAKHQERRAGERAKLWIESVLYSSPLFGGMLFKRRK